MELGQVDKNFAIKSVISEPDIRFWEIQDTKAKISGLHPAPGACCAAVLNRRLYVNYDHFGFSGNGLGEPEMAA